MLKRHLFYNNWTNYKARRLNFGHFNPDLETQRPRFNPPNALKIHLNLKIHMRGLPEDIIIKKCNLCSRTSFWSWAFGSVGILPVTSCSLVLWEERWIEMRLHAVEAASACFDTSQLQALCKNCRQSSSEAG